MKGGNYMIKKFGFTLAEVLITLGIIGVVAAMTIPTLMQRTNDEEFKSGYKKMLSVLNQAISMNYALDGVDFSEMSTEGAAADTNGKTFLGFLYNRFNVIGSGTPAGNPNEGTEIFFSDGSSIIYNTTDLGKCLTTDAVETFSDACKFIVDVNGKKGPNELSTASCASDATTCTIKDRFTVYGYKRQVSPNAQADSTDPGNWILKGN